MAEKKISQREIGTLKRVLGITDLFAIGYGDLGSSIFYALGITALFALGATPLALALAGVVFICTALTYAEMTSTFQESGGSASFARHAFNDLISFIAGWGLLLDYIVTMAISAFAVGPYLAFFYPDLRLGFADVIFSVALIAILFFINFFGVRQSTRLSFVLTAFTLGIQLILIVIGLGWLLDLPLLIDHARINVPHVDWSPSWPDFWKGTAMAMVAYTGIESIAQLGAETKKPGRTLPRAIFITMLILVVVYLTLSVTALSALSPQEISTKYLENPLAGIVDRLPFGKELLGPLMGIIAAILLFVAANAGLVGASRLAFNMGEYYQLPRVFYQVHSRFRTPYSALLIFASLAALVVILSRGRLSFLADLYNFGAMLAFFFAHLSLIVMRIKKPDLKRSFRIAGNIKFRGASIPLTAIVGCLATAAVWVLIVITKPEGRYLGLIWMGVGLIMYFIYRSKKNIKAMGQITIEKIKMPHFKPLVVKHLLLPTRAEWDPETVQAACEFAKLHNAKISAVYVLEVPYTMPLDANIFQRLNLAEQVLKKTEVIAREFGVQIDVQIVRARVLSEAILQLVHEQQCDLLVLGPPFLTRKGKIKEFGSVAEEILKGSSCRLWICAHHNGK